MKLNLLGEWLSWLEESEIQNDFASYMDDLSMDSNEEPLQQGTNSQDEGGDESRIFQPVKQLCERDNIIIDMLNSASSGRASTVSFCVTDPSQLDNPVIFISDGFSALTGYGFDECVGR